MLTEENMRVTDHAGPPDRLAVGGVIGDGVYRLQANEAV